MDDPTNTPKPAENNPPAPDPGPPAPPATKIVAEGAIAEEALRLRRENEELRSTVKARECDVATARDEFQRYRQTVEAAKPPTKRLLGLNRR